MNAIVKVSYTNRARAVIFRFSATCDIGRYLVVVNVMPPPDPARIERNIRSLAMWRIIFGLLMIGLPLGAHALFERQAKRLDALGDHGKDATATVTQLDRDGNVYYAYEIEGAPYDWSVAEKAAPYPVGRTFPILYLPEDPSFSRPGSDRAVGVTEAAGNRSFAHKAELILFLFFGINMIACHFSLSRMRSTGTTERDDATAYRNRLIFAALALSTLIVPMIMTALQDAASKGESIWSVVLGFGFTFAIVVGSGFYLLRHGRANVAARSARILKWAAPLAAGIAALRFIAWLVIQR